MLERIHQQTIERLLYPLLTRYRGSRELAILAELQASQFWSADRLEELRLQRLRDMLKHAAEFVPFYRRRFAEAGFDPESLKSFDDLQRLPILTKQEIQEHREQLISTAFPRESLVENRTGGSTGSPLVFYHTKERMQQRQAATLRHNLWAGYRVGSKTAILWGHQVDLSHFQSVKARLRNALVDRQLICDSSSFSEKTLGEFVSRYRRFRPEIILAYANSLAYVVEYCRAGNIELPLPRAIITSAEVLTAENRASIEAYFGCKIFDRYGSRETSVIASECEAHDGLHICAEFLHLEYLRDDAPVAAGNEGELVVTSLANYAFPFIRYQIGDIGAAAPAGCSCGRTPPKMKMVAGRTTDFLLAPDGRRVSGAALTIYLAAKVPGVRQAQIVQRQRNELIFNLAVDARFTDDSRELIRRKVTHFFGEFMNLEFRYVDAIPKEVSGKYRFSICEIPQREKSK